MSEPLPVIVAPPSDTGGRRVRVHGENLGLAYNLEDLSEFLRRAGLDVDPVNAAVSPSSTGAVWARSTGGPRPADEGAPAAVPWRRAARTAARTTVVRPSDGARGCR